MLHPSVGHCEHNVKFVSFEAFTAVVFQVKFPWVVRLRSVVVGYQPLKCWYLTTTQKIST